MIYASNNVIYQFFNDFCPKTAEYLQNSSDFYEIVYSFFGDVTLQTDSKIFKFSRRSIVILPPNSNRKFFSEHDKPVKLFSIAFDRTFIDGKFDDIDDFILSPFQTSNSSSLHLFFLSLQSLERRNLDNDIFISYLENIIPLILLDIFNSNLKKLSSAPASNLIRDVVKHVNDNVTKPLTVESIANVFFVSRSFLSHEFKKQLGVSIKQYITRKKMLYARKLIRSGVKPTKASSLCGFENYSTFFRQYKAYFEETPESFDVNE